MEEMSKRLSDPATADLISTFVQSMKPEDLASMLKQSGMDVSEQQVPFPAASNLVIIIISNNTCQPGLGAYGASLSSPGRLVLSDLMLATWRFARLSRVCWTTWLAIGFRASLILFVHLKDADCKANHDQALKRHMHIRQANPLNQLFLHVWLSPACHLQLATCSMGLMQCIN